MPVKEDVDFGVFGNDFIVEVDIMLVLWVKWFMLTIYEIIFFSWYEWEKARDEEVADYVPWSGRHGVVVLPGTKGTKLIYLSGKIKFTDTAPI